MKLDLLYWTPLFVVFTSTMVDVGLLSKDLFGSAVVGGFGNLFTIYSSQKDGIIIFMSIDAGLTFAFGSEHW